MHSDPPNRELVDKAYAVLEAKGPTDFARKLGYGPNGYQKVHRWLTSETPSIPFRDAWLLLNIVGWIRTEPLGIELVEDAVRRLDEGTISAQERRQVAKLADRLQADIGLLADRLRVGARAARKS